MTLNTAHWDQRYQLGDTPWDSGIVERELVRILKDKAIAPSRAFEFGCGAGTNAVFLAQQGFDVVAADCSTTAIDRASRLSAVAGVRVNFVTADLCSLSDVRRALGPDAISLERSFPLLFDRGCFHCLRKVNLTGLLETLDWLAAPGARFLMLCGNPNEKSEGGPPRVSEEEIQSELGGLFEIEAIRAFHFEDRGGITGPLGWSCQMTRRTTQRNQDSNVSDSIRGASPINRRASECAGPVGDRTTPLVGIVGLTMPVCSPDWPFR